MYNSISSVYLGKKLWGNVRTNESNTFKNDKLNTWHNGMEALKEWLYNPSLETKNKDTCIQNGIIEKVWESKCFRYTELRIIVRYPNENIL